jgi:hypothetical protein
MAYNWLNMDGVVKRYGKQEGYNLSINPSDYPFHPDLTPKNQFRRAFVAIDETSPVQIDSTRLMVCFEALRAKDHKYYFYILSKLITNDLPIHVNLQEMRKYTKDRTYQMGQHGLNRLVKQGLLFRLENRNSQYIVNPVYAWKGNRLDYLDTAAFDSPTPC